MSGKRRSRLITPEQIAAFDRTISSETTAAAEWLSEPGRLALAWRVLEIEKKWPGLPKAVDDFFEGNVRQFFDDIHKFVLEACVQSDLKVDPKERAIVAHKRAQSVVDTLYEWAFAKHQSQPPKRGRRKGPVDPTRDMALWKLWRQAKEGKLLPENGRLTQEQFADLMVSTPEYQRFWGIGAEDGEGVILRRLKEYSKRSRRG
jgi:hypothetical protein